MGPWLLLDSHEAVVKALSRYKTRQRDWPAMEHAIRVWGRTSLLMWVTVEQYRALVEAHRRDPRNGFEKRKALDLLRERLT